MWESFGWILLNPEFICVIGTVLSYLGNWGNRVSCWNSTKVWEINRKSGKEKILNFDNHIIEIPANRVGVKCSKCPKRNQLGQFHCRNREKKFVAMPLSKMGGKKKKKRLPKYGEELKKKSVTFTIFLQHFHNKSQMISYY